ncbi:MAG: Fic family protein [Akkermansiaceae bacterium]
MEASDRSGDSTAFAEFSLATIHEAMAIFLHELKIVAVTGEDRVELTRRNFAAESFSRKQYLAHFKTISTATASRDLKLGGEGGFLTKQGKKSQTVYRYSQ